MGLITDEKYDAFEDIKKVQFFYLNTKLELSHTKHFRN